MTRILFLIIITLATTVQAEDLIPTMTSSTTPSGIVSTSSEYSAEFAAWLAFDDDTNTNWSSKLNALPCTISYGFDQPIDIQSYTINAVRVHTYAPTAWTFEGSTDGMSWIVLDTQNNPNLFTSIFIMTFPVSGTYRYYRLNINGGRYTNVAIDEMSIQGTPNTNVNPGNPTVELPEDFEGFTEWANINAEQTNITISQLNTLANIANNLQVGIAFICAYLTFKTFFHYASKERFF